MSAKTQAAKTIATNTFVEMEKKWLKHWEEKGTIQKYLHKNDRSDKRFSFQDGPITANNPMGVHHGWGRTYKDIWQKFYNLQGCHQRFQNGFDCQGLWVEVEVEKELGLKSKKDIENLIPGNYKASIAKFVELCRKRVYHFSGIQTEQSKRLGYFMDWEHSYFTMSPENNYMIWYFLKKCYENGWIYKGRESVPWCPRCETAISQHEMLTEDYKEIVHDSIYLGLPIIGKNHQYLIIWTTTPWTIPANIAVAVDEDLDYSLVKGTTGDLYWVAKEAAKRVFAGDYQSVVKTVKGKTLVGMKYRAPFDQLPSVKEVADKNPETFHTVIATDSKILPISTQEGTGLVHTAVSAGTEDFKLGKKYGLPMVPVIADNADYLDGLGFLSGKNAKKHPEIILDYLKKKDTEGENWVFNIFKYKHRYPACWRCKTELVWKVEDEWYIAMDKKSKVKSQKSKEKTLRERMVEVAKQIKWLPEFGLDRELDWLKNMHDWLISKKNRYWGLALPIYQCKDCNSFEVIGSKEELKKRAVAGWEKFDDHSPHKPFIDEVKIRCNKCNSEVSRTNDVGNPWLDAGIVGFSTITKNNKGIPLYLSDKKEWEKWFPADFITESFPGQFKNWFYSLIAMSTVLEDVNPFKTVLGFGTLLGEDGRPMHKSWGNSIAFQEGADIIGVDVMRWMYSRQNPPDNMLFGYRRADEVRRQFYLIFWNIYRYFSEYSALDKINLKEIKSDIYQSSNVLDKWAIARLNYVITCVSASLKQYDARAACAAIEELVSDISTWYIRRSRDRVGFHSKDLADKQAFFSTLHCLLVDLSIILSPFMPFITEEICTVLTNGESVHLSSWPKGEGVVDKLVIDDMQIVRNIVEVAHRVRKELRIKLRQPLALVTVSLPQNTKFSDTKVQDQYQTLLKNELNVKEIVLKQTKTLEIKVEFDINITPELQLEGELRDLVRKIQSQRKAQGITLSQKIQLTVPEKFRPFTDYLKRNVQAKNIRFADQLEVK